MQETIVVVPCYNEEKRLDAAAPREFAAHQPSFSFVLVDDGSTDATAEVIEGLAKHDGTHFEALRLDHNQGKAEAVRQGMLRAMQRSPKLIAYLDADLATPLSELPPMCTLFEDEKLELVLASRVALLGRSILRSPSRHYLGRIFATTAARVVDLTVYDTQCGAKVFRNTDAVRSVFATPFTVRWSFDVEILARMLRLAEDGTLAPLDRCAAEYPLRAWRDVGGSKLGIRAAAGAALELAQIWRRYRWPRQPPSRDRNTR